MKITSVELKHTNPSMGPHERIITFNMSNSSEHEQEFEQLLQESTVNGDLPLIDFLKAYQEDNQALIQKIFSKNDHIQLNKGGTISNFSMALESGPVVKISDLRTVHLGGYYGTFIPYLVKNGHRNEFSGWDEPLFELDGLYDTPQPTSKVKEIFDEEGEHSTDK